MDLLHLDLYKEEYFEQHVFCMTRPSACVVTSSAIHNHE